MDTAINTQATGNGVLDAQTDRLLQRAKSSATVDAGADSNTHTKMVKAGKDFESILLGSWLQQAEQSFARVPGGDGQDDDDSGKDQLQGIAMQALAGSLTASGGIGIAKLITKHLHANHDKGEHSSEGADPLRHIPDLKKQA